MTDYTHKIKASCVVCGATATRTRTISYHARLNPGHTFKIEEHRLDKYGFQL